MSCVSHVHCSLGKLLQRSRLCARCELRHVDSHAASVSHDFFTGNIEGAVICVSFALTCSTVRPQTEGLCSAQRRACARARGLPSIRHLRIVFGEVTVAATMSVGAFAYSNAMARAQANVYAAEAWPAKRLRREIRDSARLLLLNGSPLRGSVFMVASPYSYQRIVHTLLVAQRLGVARARALRASVLAS